MKLRASRRRTLLSAALTLGMLVALTIAPPSAFAAAIVVDSATDDGTGCTLREAITAANANSAQGGCTAGSGADVITFNIAGTGQHTISPTSELPAITETVEIDGSSDPDDDGRIEIDGSGAALGADGFEISNGSGTVIRHFVINGFATGAGVRIQGLFATGNFVFGSLIGVQPNGTTPAPNQEGVVIEAGSTGNQIGGDQISPLQRNVISGNTLSGIDISGVGAADNIISTNRIGTDIDGTIDIGNGGDGIRIAGAPDTIINGAGPSIVVSGNGGDGIEVSGADGTVIRNAFIGTQFLGNAGLGNDVNGIHVRNATNTQIGTGSTSNTIGTNGEDGVLIERTAGAGPDLTTVVNNRIGIGLNGTTGLGNGDHGVQIQDSAGNTIGGAGLNDRNVISDNGSSGVAIFGTSSTGNLLEANRIGTNANGDAAVGNALSGITIFQAPGNTLRDNLISGNDWDGVTIVRPEATGNVLQGNTIGRNLAKNASVPNGVNGVFVYRAPGTLIGGTGAFEGNMIAGNTARGVVVAEGGTPSEAVDNAIVGNRIFDNGNIGIDLGGTIDPGGDGVTANDGSGDPDQGPNNFQNFPDLSAVTSGSTHVLGTLDGEPSTTYRLEFFSNPSGADPSGNGEGEIVVEAAEVTTNGAGTILFALTLAETADVGDALSATATELAGDGTPLSTSEFSANVAVTACPGPKAGTPDDDILCGGAGNNTFLSTPGDDYYAGGGGKDTVKYAGAAGRVRANLGRGIAAKDGDGDTDFFSSIENLVGSAQRDILRGSGGRNVLRGGGGNDLLLGLGAFDLLVGGSGRDTGKGGPGGDALRGNGGNDNLLGQAGNDNINGGAGNRDRCRQGPGSGPVRNCER